MFSVDVFLGNLVCWHPFVTHYPKLNFLLYTTNARHKDTENKTPVRGQTSCSTNLSPFLEVIVTEPQSLLPKHRLGVTFFITSFRKSYFFLLWLIFVTRSFSLFLVIFTIIHLFISCDDKKGAYRNFLFDSFLILTHNTPNFQYIYMCIYVDRYVYVYICIYIDYIP